MTRYKQQPLFVSGPSRLHVHGVDQRHVSNEAIAGDGATLTALGHTARRIDQTGTLIADRPLDLEAQRQAVEQAMDGQPGELADDLGRRFPAMVLLRFETDPIHRIGPRWAMNYRASYTQVGPPEVMQVSGGEA